MPLVNIIDNRKRKYRFRKINAIVEAAWHDNRCKDSDQVYHERASDIGPDYEEKEHITLREAVNWANCFEGFVTLYLYDEDDGIYPITHRYGSPPTIKQETDDVDG